MLQVSAQQAVDYLNELNELDPEWLRSIIEARLPCNESIALHPTLQAGQSVDGETYEAGFLGIINGLFGVEVAPIEMDLTDRDPIDPIKGTIQGFRLRKRYELCQ